MTAIYAKAFSAFSLDMCSIARYLNPRIVSFFLLPFSFFLSFYLATGLTAEINADGSSWGSRISDHFALTARQAVICKIVSLRYTDIH